MGIELEWLLEKRVILHRNIGDVTTTDLLDIDTPLNVMLAEGEQHMVHVIVLAAPDGKGPTSLKAFTAATWTRNNHLGWTIVVGLENPVVRFVADVGSQVSRMKVKFVDTFEEAIEILKRVDLSLPDDMTIPKADDDEA